MVRNTLQRSAKRLVCGCEKFVPALAYLPQEKWDWFESSLKKDKIRQKQPNEMLTLLQYWYSVPHLCVIDPLGM